MIKKIILPILAILILGSCANKFSLVKRKYNKGYYLDLSKNAVSKKSETEKIATLTPKKIESVSQNNPSTAVEIKSSPIKTLPIMASLATVESKKHTVQPITANHLTASGKKQPTKSNISIKPLVLKSNDSKSGKGSDTNLLILIILSLFPILCLIAIYLHDGKKITLNFWIDLLLHLTFILEIVFAILVVLDIINLA